MVLMVQKEVAERIAGRNKLARRRGGESLLSISVKAYGRPEIIRKVRPDIFLRRQKVDSAVLKISGISKEFFQDISEKKFLK